MTENVETTPNTDEIKLVAEVDELGPKKSFGKRVLVAGSEVVAASIVYLLVSIAMTWPMIMHPQEVILGGGELGGWLWRQWWHFEEVRSLDSIDLGIIGTIETLVSLGRFPETGNILDLLLLSYPLRDWVGTPFDHNLKILIILVGNGVCGYALARSFTDSRLVSLAAGVIALINPLVIQDINKIGLRQTLLWWLLLFPITLQRAGRRGRVVDGVMVGLLYTLIAAFYWFYGLFAAMFGVIWLSWWWIKTRPPFAVARRWLTPAGVVAVFGVSLFLVPYFSADGDDSGGGGTERLPEVTFFLSFPQYDTIKDVPQRPSNYRENVLSSLHRGIDSAWPADYVLDPRHGVLAFPVLVLLVGVIPGVFLARARMWFLVWMVFWLGTLGPFLKLGAQRDTSEVFMLGDYVVRLPFTLMFQFIPGMSRMFAPYRMSSMVVVAAVALLAISLDRVRTPYRPWVAVAVFIGIVLQPFYRFDLGPVGAQQARPDMWRIPLQMSSIRVPEWYKQRSASTWEGIIELPLEQQQDLLCTYQSIHRQKVYRSWATIPAVPPGIRHSGGGREGRRMRWLAKSEPRGDRTEDFFRNISREPLETGGDQLNLDALRLLMDYGSYRWMIVHQRGYYLFDPSNGDVLYRDVVRKLQETLGIEPERIIEQEAHDWPGKSKNFPVGPAWIPWASQEVQKPTQDMPTKYEMAVFDLQSLLPEEGDVIDAEVEQK